MITIKTGELFVEMHNEMNGTNLTPKEVFLMLAEKAFKGGRHMVNWTNSKFFSYLKEYNKFLRGEKDEPSFEDALDSFCYDLENVDCGVETSLNVYGGCGVPKSDEMQTTEFNYCDNIHFTIDERYCSFIGSFFQLCISGFYTFIEDKNAIRIIYEAFNKYYDFIHENENVDDKQLPSWNACYLYMKATKQNDGFIEENKLKKGHLESLSYLEFLDIITKAKWKRTKNILFENFGQTNTSAGYITIDLDGVAGIFSIMKTVIGNVGEGFNIKEYSKIFGKENLLRDSLEMGQTTKDMIDPLYEFRNDIKNSEIKNKNGIKFLTKYLSLIMTKEEIELSKKFGGFIKTAPSKGNKGNSVKKEVNDIFVSRNVKCLGDAIIAFCEKVGVDYNEGVPYEVISYFVSGNNSNRLSEFIMFTKFNS